MVRAWTNSLAAGDAAAGNPGNNISLTLGIDADQLMSERPDLTRDAFRRTDGFV